MKLKRWQKNVVHGLMLVALAWTLIHEGKQLDWLFFAFSVVCEVC
jgi:hypothetical protein